MGMLSSSAAVVASAVFSVEGGMVECVWLVDNVSNSRYVIALLEFTYLLRRLEVSNT